MIKEEKGVVLIVTLWILAILTLLAISFAQRMRVEIKLIGFQIDSLRSLYLARAGVNYALAKLKKSPNDYDSLEVELGKGKFIIYIEDEERKININYATKPMLEKLGLSEDIVCAIIDWRDTDNDVTKPYGVEDYQSLNPPYPCKNAPVDSIQEILLVKGITSEILYGDKGIAQWVTVYGKGIININTAPKKVLATLPGIDEQLAQNIIWHRAGFDGQDGTEDDIPFKSNDDIIGVIGGDKYNQINQLITTDSNNFKIIAIGIVKKVIRKISTIIDTETGKIKYYRED